MNPFGQNALTRLALIALLPLLGAACASGPQNRVAIAPSADAEREIATAQSEISYLKQEQAEVLAPKAYERAQRSLSDALSARADGDSTNEVLEKVAESRGFSADARAKVEQVRRELSSVLENRAGALRAGALQFEQGKLDDADDKLKDLSDDLYANDRDNLADRTDRLNRAYLEVEGKAAVKSRLSAAKRDIELAKDEGAARVAPNTLNQAELQYERSEKAIAAAPRNAALVTSSAEKATAASAKLLSVTRQAKNVREGSPEEIALRQMERAAQVSELRESRAEAVGAAESAEATAQAASASAQAARARNAELVAARDSSLDAKAELVRAQFTSEEAEVLADGENVIVRMRGLQFPTNQATISSDQYPLLTKLKNALSAAAPSSVVIEGHTDSIGGKQTNEALSSKRAEAVKSYLVSTEAVDASQVDARGYGYEKPLTTNKTAAGRATNRRVDVVLKL